MEFPVHTLETAPEPSKALLQALKLSVGMIPNLAAGMSESPPLLAGFLAIRDIYQQGTFSGAEIQVISLTAAFENDCAWCMAFHSLMAAKERVPADAIEALREGRAPADARLAALSDLAREMIRTRGAPSADTLDRFTRVGYTRAQVLEVILGLAFSLLANYAGHLVNPPLDAPLQAHAWQAVAA